MNWLTRIFVRDAEVGRYEMEQFRLAIESGARTLANATALHRLQEIAAADAKAIEREAAALASSQAMNPMEIVPNDPCPGCGGERFTIGCTTIVGRRGAIVTESAVVCCLACGEHWYGTPQGWRKPCESALPPAWAAQRVAARMEAAQAELLRERRRERDDGKGLTRRRAANEGYRRPPPPDEE